MRRHTRPLAVLAAVAATALLPGVAHAAPPTNDDFDTAVAVTALPFAEDLNTAEATTAADDPDDCQNYSSDQSVWYRYTALEDAVLRATFGSRDFAPAFVAFTGDRGALLRVPGSCGGGFTGGERQTFHVEAGETYHLMVTGYWGSGGPLHFGLEDVPPSPNDAFAAATPIAAPSAELTGDLARASAEPGEPVAICAGEGFPSVWYRYTPTTSASITLLARGDGTPGVSVHEGAGLADLSEVACKPAGSSGYAVFSATAGHTYHIRVSADIDDVGWYGLTADIAPPLSPWLSTNGSRLSSLVETWFTVYPGDDLGRPVVDGYLDFGDGRVVDLTGDQQTITHRYAADGEYRVRFAATTSDGRTGTGEETVVVHTRDIAATALTAPATARVGQTKPVSVSVANTRHDESVVVTLYKVVDGNEIQLGRSTQWVPARPTRTTTFPFAYTATAADATAGTVTFRAVAALADDSWVLDDNPDDNRLEKQMTVRPRAAGMS